MTQKKSGLGRGLGALLDNPSTDITSKNAADVQGAPYSGLTQIPLSEIETNPFQPRTYFDQEAITELSQSIAQHGIIQPITVRKLGFGKYQIISGERRFRASQLAGLDRIPAYVRVANDQSMLEMALVENIQREDLDAIEVALSYKRLLEECNLTQETLSQKVGKKRSTIANYLRLLKLPAEVQLAIRTKKLSMGHARALAGLEDSSLQLSLLQQILNHDLSVREVEDAAKKHGTTPKLVTGNKLAHVPLSFREQKIQEDWQKMINANIIFKRKSNNAGEIVIPYTSEEQLEKILAILES